jgi:hypothetical protein
MSNQEVIDKIIELKVIGIKEQEFEVCSHLRNKTMWGTIRVS